MSDAFDNEVYDPVTNTWTLRPCPIEAFLAPYEVREGGVAERAVDGPCWERRIAVGVADYRNRVAGDEGVLQTARVVDARGRQVYPPRRLS